MLAAQRIPDTGWKWRCVVASVLRRRASLEMTCASAFYS
jgi:hypothetical protein